MKSKTRWVKTNSPLHKQLQTAKFIGKREGQDEIIKFLSNHSAFTDDFIAWIVVETMECLSKESK